MPLLTGSDPMVDSFAVDNVIVASVVRLVEVDKAWDDSDVGATVDDGVSVVGYAVVTVVGIVDCDTVVDGIDVVVIVVVGVVVGVVGSVVGGGVVATVVTRSVVLASVVEAIVDIFVVSIVVADVVDGDSVVIGTGVGGLFELSISVTSADVSSGAGVDVDSILAAVVVTFVETVVATVAAVVLTVVDAVVGSVDLGAEVVVVSDGVVVTPFPVVVVGAWSVPSFAAPMYCSSPQYRVNWVSEAAEISIKQCNSVLQLWYTCTCE